MAERRPLQMVGSHIIGHQEAQALLLRAVERETLPHGLLFAGPAGVGKKAVARSIAAAILERSRSDGPPASKLVAAGSHPDLHFLRAPSGKRDIPVEAVRELSSALHLRPYAGRSAVAIIDDAHQMSLPACNALLMTLEEPPSNSFLILVTDSPQRLPATILSRCQTIPFGLLSEKDLLGVLGAILGTEGSDLAPALAAFGDGSLAPLRLGAFIDPKTGVVEDRKGMLAHLRSVSEMSEEVISRIMAHLSKGSHGRDPASPGARDARETADAVILARELAAMKDDPELIWQALFAALRRSIRDAPHMRLPLLANLLGNAVQLERSAKERSLSLDVQLAALFMGA